MDFADKAFSWTKLFKYYHICLQNVHINIIVHIYRENVVILVRSDKNILNLFLYCDESQNQLMFDIVIDCDIYVKA